MSRLEGFTIVVAATVATLVLPPFLYAQGDPAPRGNAGANLPSSPADRGGGGGSMPGGGATGGGGSSSGDWGGGGTTTGGNTGGGWHDPGGAAARRAERGSLVEGGSRRFSNDGGTSAEIPWYSRDRGDRPLTGTPAGREGGPGRPVPPGWQGGGNNDWWYWGYAYGPLYYPGYRFHCGPMWGYGAFGLGYFYYDPMWWAYRYGCGIDGWSGAWDLLGYSGGGGGGSGYPQNFAESGLKLKVKPSNAQVFVDGYFAGEVDEFDSTFQRLPLKAGTHKIEIRAAGYAPLTFEISVEPYQTATYRGELQKLK